MFIDIGDKVELIVGSHSKDCQIRVEGEPLPATSFTVRGEVGKLTTLTITTPVTARFGEETFVGYWIDESLMESFRNWLRDVWEKQDRKP